MTFKLGTTYVDSRDDRLWVIENYTETAKGTLYTVHNTDNQYKRHYKSKLESIAKNICSA